MIYKAYYSDELYHYGVKGMRWGVIRDPERKERRAFTKKLQKDKKARDEFIERSAVESAIMGKYALDRPTDYSYDRRYSIAKDDYAYLMEKDIMPRRRNKRQRFFSNLTGKIFYSTAKRQEKIISKYKNLSYEEALSAHYKKEAIDFMNKWEKETGESWNEAYKRDHNGKDWGGYND